MKRFIFLLCMIAMPAFAAELGDDGLHKTDWMLDTLKDLSEDLAEANDEGKRLALMIEQRGCIYCSKMHQEVYPREDVSNYIRDNFFVVQINLRSCGDDARSLWSRDHFGHVHMG